MYTIAKAASLTLDGRWCLNPVGSLELALNADRLRELHRRHGYAESWGLEAPLSSIPTRRRRLWPLLDRAAIVGAYHVPSDGLTDSVRVSEAQARRATEGGAGSSAATPSPASGPTTVGSAASSRIAARFDADIVVCAAGIWGPRIGALVGMTIPLQPLAHQLSWTTVLPEVVAFDIPTDNEAIHPNIRVQDRDMYFREYPDHLAVGGYGHVPLPVEQATILSAEPRPR